MTVSIKIPKEYLYQQYIINKKTGKEIATEYNCAFSTIYRHLARLNIPTRPFCGPESHVYKDGSCCKKYYCIDCGKEISLGHKRCKKCWKKFNIGENHTNYKGKKTFCIDCGKKICIESKRCKQCYYNFAKGENSPIYKSGKPKCVDCGKIITQDALRCKKCYGKSISGHNNYNYIDGRGRHFPYPSAFSKNLKQQIRERDNFECQKCGLKEKDHYRGNKKAKLTIHHIDYNIKKCNKNNLITLCNICNIKANGDRDYWYAYYTYIIENYK